MAPVKGISKRLTATFDLQNRCLSLLQRDVVYVEPNEAMVQNSKIGTTTRLWVRGASIVILLGSLLYRVLEN